MAYVIKQVNEMFEWIVAHAPQLLPPPRFPLQWSLYMDATKSIQKYADFAQIKPSDVTTYHNTPDPGQRGVDAKACSSGD